MESYKAGIKRTRSGCWNCKKRRRRCDEKKPYCSGCQKRGLPCHYGIRLLWEQEAESMGIAFGRTGTRGRPGKNKKNYTISHYLIPGQLQTARFWLNTTSDDIRCLYDSDGPRHHGITTDGETLPAQQSGHDNIISFSLSQFPSLAEIDLFLFHYFSHSCTIRRSLVDYDNPWRSVLLPLCYQSEGLLHMAIAWAAHILRNQCASQDIPHYDQMILAHKCRSLKYLRNMVPQYTEDKTVSLAGTKAERDALLLLVMFHCLLEVASGSIKEWTYHMRGALLIIKFYTNPSLKTSQDVFSHEVLELVYSFFLEKGTFLGTTMTDTTSNNERERDLDSLGWSTEVPAIFPFLTGRGSVKINPCMGLSHELLDIISSISNLARIRHARSLSRPQKNHPRDITQEFTALHSRLNNLETQTKPAGQANAGTDATNLMGLHSRAFETATWIYLHHAIGDEPRHSEVIQRVHLPVLLDALSQIHRMHGSLLGFLPYPMWALFIASCVVLEEDRVKILEWFTVLSCNKPVSNVPSTMAAVEAIWKRRDLESDKDGASSHSLSASVQVEKRGLIWTTAITQLGWKMPFT